MSDTFANNPDYREYESLLIRLARLMADGKGDTDEADELREIMDQPWLRLSGSEQARLNQLSGDLFMIGDAELYEVPPSEAPSPEDLGKAVQAAYQRQDWHNVLSLLRRGPVSAQKHLVAALRSVAYERIGHLDAAFAFIEYGATLLPNNSYFESHSMALLKEIGRFGEAHDRARKILNRSGTSIELLVQSALMLLMLREQVGEESAMADTRLVVKQLLKRLPREKPATQLLTAIQSSAYFALGSAHEFLNEIDQALSAYSKALQLEPGDDMALLARGALRLKSQRPGAREDFEAAAAARSQSPLPYIALARMALDAGDYRKCVSMCNFLSFRLTDGKIMATIFVWRAIAESNLGVSRADVVNTLKMAHDCDPANPVIGHYIERLRHSEQHTSFDHELINRSIIATEQLARLRPSLESRFSSLSEIPQQYSVA